MRRNWILISRGRNQFSKISEVRIEVINESKIQKSESTPKFNLVSVLIFRESVLLDKNYSSFINLQEHDKISRILIKKVLTFLFQTWTVAEIRDVSLKCFKQKNFVEKNMPIPWKKHHKAELKKNKKVIFIKSDCSAKF